MDQKTNNLEIDRTQHNDDFYPAFKKKLENVYEFPTYYVFKFVVPSDESIIARLHTIFEKENPSISNRESRTGKYTSLTIKVFVNDANDIVHYYKEVSNIEKVVML